MKVVVIGGGFGGLNAVRALHDADVEVVLIDKRNFHLFQPLLYQVATGGLSPANIAAPLRAILKRQRNASTIMAEVQRIDPVLRQVVLEDQVVEYDRLILAAGSENHYFGHPAWPQLAPGLKSVEDAARIRALVLSAFEQAERCTETARQRELLTFVVVGGGPTGIELAGAISEIAHHTLRNNFRRIEPSLARVMLIEGHATVIGDYPPRLSAEAIAALRRMRIEVRLNTRVVEVTPSGVVLSAGEGQGSTRVNARTVLWAAGIRAAPLGTALAEATGCETDQAGRIRVTPDLRPPGFPEIYVIGDMASAPGPKGKPLPAIAPVAIQQGRFAARQIKRELRGQPARNFRYRHYGNMVTIGRAMAIADLGRVRLTGYIGWLAWLFIHLMYLVGFDNRVLVLIQWFWYYVTWNRSARLITGDCPQDRAGT